MHVLILLVIKLSNRIHYSNGLRFLTDMVPEQASKKTTTCTKQQPTAAFSTTTYSIDIRIHGFALPSDSTIRLYEFASNHLLYCAVSFICANVVCTNGKTDYPNNANTKLSISLWSTSFQWRFADGRNFHDIFFPFFISRVNVNCHHQYVEYTCFQVTAFSAIYDHVWQWPSNITTFYKTEKIPFSIAHPTPQTCFAHFYHQMSQYTPYYRNMFQELPTHSDLDIIAKIVKNLWCFGKWTFNYCV